MKTAFCLAVAAAACSIGCGKVERTEAVRLTKVLAGKQPDFARANTIESDFLASARAWCGGITAAGAGHGDELQQNAVVAAELAKSAVAVSAELGRVREAVSGQSFTKEYLEGLRGSLISQLTTRQRMLQEARTLLEQSAPQFLQYRKDKTYVGDTYPSEIVRLTTLLAAYKGPEDNLGAALTDLKTKYHVTSRDL